MPPVAIRVLRPGDEPTLETFLRARLTSSMILLGNLRAAGLDDRGERYQGTYAAAFEGECIVGVVAHYWNNKLLLQAPVHLPALVKAAVRASGRPVAGCLGPADQALAAARALGIELDGSRTHYDEIEGLYVLDLDRLIVPPALADGQVVGRRIAPRDVELVARWMKDYAITTLGQKDHPNLLNEWRLQIEHNAREGMTWLLEAGGRPVATCGFHAVLAEAVQVGGVWTPPRLRGCGYARCVVAAALRDVHAAGVAQATLFTGDNNVPARRAYVALGFQRVGDYRLTLLDPPIQGSAAG